MLAYGYFIYELCSSLIVLMWKIAIESRGKLLLANIYSIDTMNFSQGSHPDQIAEETTPH